MVSQKSKLTRTIEEFEHDLRTPLSIIKNEAAVVKVRGLNDSAEALESQVARIQTLLEELSSKIAEDYE